MKSALLFLPWLFPHKVNTRNQVKDLCVEDVCTYGVLTFQFSGIRKTRREYGRYIQ
jgi:hypothetical protein